MNQVRLFRVLGLAAITSMFSLMLAAQAGDRLAAIQQSLNSQFQLTSVTANRSDIVTPGSEVTLHREGLIMYEVASPLPPSNTYKNGKIVQGWGGLGKDMAIGMLTPGSGSANDYRHRQFVAEEKCWVTGIQVQKDGVLFQLYRDAHHYSSYYANLKIPFPNKKEIPPVETVMQLVAEVLTVAPADGQGIPGAYASEPAPAPEPVPAPSYAPIAPPAPAPMQAIAPPPPPADAPPPTIALGQTMDLVTANFGQPLRIAKLGAKVIYYYKDMKVTFQDGQVSDVQ